MSPKLKTFIERGISTVILLSLLGGTVAWNSPWGYAILVCVLCNLTTYEWFNMQRERAEESNRPLALLAGLAYPWVMGVGMLTDTFASQSFPLIALAYLVFYVLLAFFCELFSMDYKGRSGAQALSSMGMTVLSFVYPVWLFGFALYSLTSETAIMTLLWLVLVTKMSDIWAYVSGVLLGGKFFSRRFSPVVSPKKTWEGIIGSFIITSLCAWGLMGMAEFPFEVNLPILFLVMMPCLFILSVAGDLAGSLIKRGLAVKDSGSLLPGIGGIFDLIDSPAFTVSFATMVMYLI